MMKSAHSIARNPIATDIRPRTSPPRQARADSRRLLRRGLFGLAFALAGLVAGAAPAPVRTAAFDHTHAELDKVLKAHVKDGLVDYAGLKAHRQELDLYLGRLAAVKEGTFNGWTELQQLAFLSNAYNATTLRLIIDHYPVKSIKDIGSWFKGPWDQPVVNLWGRKLTLNHLEHKILRQRYHEPRLHFALVCAAMGCPPLRAEAYVADRLDAQLTDQARQFLGTSSKNRVEAARHVVYLSPIFKWYGKDFEKQSGSVLAALKPWWPKSVTADPAAGRFKIRYTEYDWSLNRRAP